jgi:hypothetical protein
MPVSADNLRFILGLKLKNLRTDQDLSLKDVSERAGLSISYLSEIEKGKKYPKPDKLLDLSRALDVPFDDLVSLKLDQDLNPIKEVFDSTFVREFPFELFGLTPRDLFDLTRDEPGKAGALFQTFLDVGRMYDVQVEHFLFAALRSYQQMHANYFEEIEAAADAFRRAHDWPEDGPVGEDRLRSLLETEYGYQIDTTTLHADPHLNELRSVYDASDGPRLYVNCELLPEQRTFVYGREIGFLHLGLTDRPRTSSWIQATSFDEVLNNFRASYFSGALLIPQDRLYDDLDHFFAKEQWAPELLLETLSRYGVTPEMLFYRLTELIPERFGLREIYFQRFHNDVDTDRFQMTKVLNMSRVPVPHGLSLGEHYCRRWPAPRLLRRLADLQRSGDTPEQPLVRAQRSYFLGEDAEFFVLSLTRPLALTPGTNSSVSLGFLMDETFRERVRFWDDPAIPRVTVNLTCERCPLTPSECHDRVAPPVIFQKQQEQSRKEEALATLLNGRSG